MASVYLSVKDLNGGIISGTYKNDFEISDYSFSVNLSGNNLFSPLQVTLNSLDTAGANSLLEDAYSGKILPAVNLIITNSANKIVENISLTNATVVEAQQGDGQAAYAFDYASATMQTYTYDSAGNQVVGVPVTISTPSNSDFSSPVPVVLAVLDVPSYYLNVAGDLGFSTNQNYAGDFELSGYNFAVNDPAGAQKGQSTPLVVDLGNTFTKQGVSTLESYASSGVLIPSVTLYDTNIITNNNNAIQEVTLTNASVANFSLTGQSTGGDVQVSFNFASATIKTFIFDPFGGLANTQTSVIGGTTSANAPCYCAGTRILTFRGEVAVEALQIGDLVVTASGGLRPVVWLGHRRIDISRHSDARKVRPVRVSADAFGEGLPRRDLWLSPGHNIAFDDALIPIFALANGRSVSQVEQERVEYWHVQLDAHDVIFADGLPAESYLDTGNRAAFENGGAFIQAHPDFSPRHWADTCLPLALDGPVVTAAKARLLARLAERGREVDHESHARLVVDGVSVAPIHLSATRLAFELPAGGRDISLRSRVFTPAHSVAESDDLRRLGLCAGALQIDGAAVALGLDGPCGPGWHEAEYEEGRFTHRWTTGATPLPAGARIVIVDLAGLGRYMREGQDEVAARLH